MMELIRATSGSIWETIAARRRARINFAATATGLIVLVDQMVASATNFFTTLIIGRACLPEELGMYVLGFSFMTLALRIPKALLWTPYVAFTPSMAKDEQKSYSGSVLGLLVLYCVIAACVASAIGLGMIPREATAGLGSVFLFLGPAIAMMLLREHARRVCFSRLRPGDALLIDGAVALLQIGGLLVLALAGALTAARAYLVIAGASAPTVAVWLFVERGSLEFRPGRMISDLARNWRFARWILASAVLAGAIMAMEPWALSLMHGTVAAGIFAAAFSIVALTNPLILGFQNYFGPQAAHVFAREGVAGLRRVVLRSTMAISALAVLMMLFVFVWSEELLVLLYGSKFAGQGAVVTALILPTMIELATLPVAAGLVALSRGDVMLKSRGVQLVLALTVGMWCIYQFGPVGVGYGASVSYSGAALFSWLALKNVFADG